MVAGGHEYDGKPIVPFDYTAMRRAAEEIAGAGIHSAVVTSIFSALNPECELEAARVLREICPGIDITLSHELGRIGLLERENAALLNAALKDLAGLTIKAFEQALAESGINAPVFLSQNDGTIARAEHASAFPILSFASGPTNSMRGAAFLSNLSDAVVIDVGGTSTDVGCLHRNFPREANNAVQICGVRTLFRMPDLFSMGLGGGSIVNRAPLRIGPDSVGFRLTEEAIAFGGSTLTLSDVAVASGLIELGDRSRLDHISSNLIADTMAMVQQRIGEAADRMKPDAAPLPLIAVGGGSFLVPPKVPGFSEVVRVEHYAVANAVGAAISQVSGGIDRIFSGISRDEALRQAEELAKTKAVEAGANGSTLELVEIEDLPLAYLPGNTLRVHARVIGRLG
jgi:N-methylhydantoinase A/oxoprolinase/acetone carboxylase beta subunit